MQRNSLTGFQTHIFLGLISITVIVFQTVLIRALAIISYSHFTSFVISIALLGFGASGTILSLVKQRLEKNWTEWLFYAALLFTVSIPTCYIAATHLRLDIQYLFMSGNQIILLAAYALLLSIPFFLGAFCIGLVLTFQSRLVKTLYGANLIGSGLGGAAAVALMFTAKSSLLPLYLSTGGALALASLLEPRNIQLRRGKPLKLFIAAAAFVFTGIWFFGTISVPVDQYKSLSRFNNLETQGDAEHLLTRFGPRGRIDLFASPVMHTTLFAGIQSDAVPPDQLSLLIDGNLEGGVFRTNDLTETKILDFTPQSLPYRLISRPSVLLLGERTGINIWLAKRFNARSITVVQENPQLFDLYKDEASSMSGGIFTAPDVELIAENPRHFLDTTARQFDIIQITSAESMSAMNPGLQGMHHDYVFTVEGLRSCLNNLRQGGFVSVTRGMQTPPRDNIKLFATAVYALEKSAYPGQVGDHLLVSRNYLAATTLFSQEPFGKDVIARFKNHCRELSADTEYYPGIVSSEIEQTNVIPGPQGKPYSYLHHAVSSILDRNERARFFMDWAYDVAPATDNKPFFYNFFKWSSLPRFIEAYGSHWFRRAEMGYLVEVITLAVVVVIAFFLILLPVLLYRKKSDGLSHLKSSSHLRETGEVRTKTPTLWIVLHFLSIGFGFMFFEIIFIQFMGRLLADPALSAASIICSLLVFSGLGSTFQTIAGPNGKRRIRLGAFITTALGILYLVLLPGVVSVFQGYSLAVRFLITAVSIGPIAFFMGFFFSSGVEAMQDDADRGVPLAWGVNGFASVMASPLAVLLSIAVGFSGVMIIAALLYGGVGLFSLLLGGKRETVKSPS